MQIQKLFWAVRGIIYKASFGKFGNISYIGKPTSLLGRKHFFIGDRVRIQPGIRMEASNNGSIVVRNNTSIGQNVHITADKEELEIGENTTILGNSFITNIDHDYQKINVHIMEQERIVKTTKIGENCFIGFGACIQAGTILGKQCIVGANAVVRGSFPDYSVVVGAPARIVKQYDPITKRWEKVKHD